MQSEKDKEKGELVENGVRRHHRTYFRGTKGAEKRKQRDFLKIFSKKHRKCLVEITKQRIFALYLVVAMITLIV